MAEKVNEPVGCALADSGSDRTDAEQKFLEVREGSGVLKRG